MNNEEILDDFKKEMVTHLKRMSLLSGQLTDDPDIPNKKRMFTSIKAIQKVVDTLKPPDFDDYLPDETIDMKPENPDNTSIIEYLESGMEPDLKLEETENTSNTDFDTSF